MTVDYGSGPVDLQSPPAMLNDTTLTLRTECPYSMTVPDHPNNDVSWITGTGCALACPLALYTDPEIKEQYDVFTTSQWWSAGLMLVSGFNYFYLTSYAKRNLYFGMMLVAISLFSFFNVLVLTGREDTELVCMDNATWYSKWGAGESALSFSCAFLAVFNLVYDWLLYWIFTCEAIELWLRVVKSVKDVSFYRKIYVGGLLVVTLIFIFISLFYGPSDIDGKGGFQLLCGWEGGDLDIQFYFNTVPKIIFYSVTFLLTMHSLYVLYKIATATSSKSFEKLWNSFRAIILGSAAVSFTFPFAVFYGKTFYAYTNVDTMVVSIVEWITCLIVNFKSEGDTQYLQQCGFYPAKRVPLYLFYLIFAIFYFAAPVLMLWISFNAECRAIWKKALGPYMACIQPLLQLLEPVFAILGKFSLNISIKEDEEPTHKDTNKHQVVSVKDSSRASNDSKCKDVELTPKMSPRELSSGAAGAMTSIIGKVINLSPTGSAKIAVEDNYGGARGKDAYIVVEGSEGNV